MTTQNRQPAGIPVGGQYTTTAHSDAVDPLQRPVIDELTFSHEDAPFEVEHDGEGRYTIYATDDEGDEVASFLFEGDPADRAALEATAVAALNRQRKRLAAVSTPGRRVLWIDPDGEDVHEGAVVSTKGEIITVALDSGAEAEVFGNELMPGWANPPSLDGYDIPAPRPDQTYLDGSPITAGGSFEAAYGAFFRPLQDYEAEHGEWQTTRAPSESTLLELAGADKARLGNVRGVFLETDEKTGEPLVEVHTRNPGYCLRNDCDGSCHACLEDGISELPGFVRTTTEDGDVSHFFRPSDQTAAQRLLADKKTRQMLNHRLYAQRAIAEGKQPPWAILSPVRTGEERRSLTGRLEIARKKASGWRSTLLYADALTAALDAGESLPPKPSYQNPPNGLIGFEVSTESLARNTATAEEARTAAGTLQAELERGLPPAATALVAAEHTRLEKAAATADDRVQRSRDEIARSVALMRAWASRLHSNAAPDLTAVTKLETAISDFDWSASWPGDPSDCPPQPIESAPERE